MVLIVDTTAKHIGKAIAEELLCSSENAGSIYTGDGEYAISKRKTRGIIRDAYIENDEILIALLLYVECVPGLLLEFLETLPRRDERTRLSFLLQSGFAEGDGFLREEARKFTDPEYLPLLVRLMMGVIFKTLAKKMFQKAAAAWGCRVPLDEKVWEISRNGY